MNNFSHSSIDIRFFFRCLIIALVAILVLTGKSQISNAQADLDNQSTGELDQTSKPATPETYTGLQRALDSKLAIRKPTVYPNEMRSLFFTYWQHTLLQEAKKTFNNPNTSGIDPFGAGAAQTNFPREITLGGISYTNAEKWTVWLNGKRVTPEAVPTEILDIVVQDTYIDIKWFDGATKNIYPVRLRPHERFNLDTKLFITGTIANP